MGKRTMNPRARFGGIIGGIKAVDVAALKAATTPETRRDMADAAQSAADTLLALAAELRR